MELTIVSRDTIKPFKPLATASLQPRQKPCKLCMFDQLIPTTYAPVLFFYPITDPNFNLPKTLSHLKTSLSHALIHYYPFSGRTKNNLYIDDFDAGVPYIEARVDCRMLEFLDLQEIEVLNRFLPFHPFRKETASDDVLPLIAFQVTTFACGGITIGVSMSHKIFDIQTIDTFLKSWASLFCREDDEEVVTLSPMLHASSTFLANDYMEQKYFDFAESLWFDPEEKKYVTRRFVFDSKAIATLREKAKSELVPNPTRVETLTCFIWKHATSASRNGGTSRRASIAATAVNLRRRMKPPVPDNTIGNLFIWASAVHNPSDDAENSDELCDLLEVLHDSINGFDPVSLDAIRGDEGWRTFIEYIDLNMEVMNMLDPSPEIYAFSSWINILDEVDFGWGKPYWIGIMGKVGPSYRNVTVFVNTERTDGIEAWVTLDEKKMSILEKDPQFLAFASPTLGISNT